MKKRQLHAEEGRTLEERLINYLQEKNNETSVTAPETQRRKQGMPCTDVVVKETASDDDNDDDVND